jgi:TPR repeat protein
MAYALPVLAQGQSEHGLRIMRDQRIAEQRRNDAFDARKNVVESCERRGGRNCGGEEKVNTYESIGMLGGTLATIAGRFQSRNVETVREPTDAEKRERNEALANKGDVASAVTAGDIYRIGYRGAPVDEKKALYWYEKAATLGDLNSQLEMGWAYLLGRTLEKNITTAAKWFELAAKAGSAEAQYIFGVMNAVGMGAPLNDAAALQWYAKSAAGGDPEGENALGIRYHWGKGVAQDYKLALKWFTAAAEKNHPDAQYSLATMYSKARGVPLSFDNAYKWYAKAAEGNSMNGQFMSCFYLSSGIGVKKDLRMAELWCARAAAQGDADAKDLLASIKETAKKEGYGN